MTKIKLPKIPKLILTPLFGIIIVFSLYNFAYSDKTLPRVSVAAVDVSGMTREEAVVRLEERFKIFSEQGIQLVIEGNEEVIDPINIDLTLPAELLAQDAWSFGREGSWLEQLRARIAAPFSMRILSSGIYVDEEKLEGELAIFAEAYNIARRDLRLNIEGIQVRILTDTKPGRILDQTKAKSRILAHLSNLDVSPIELALDVDYPSANPAFADEAKAQAEAMISGSLTFSYKDKRFVAEEETIGSWITSEYEQDRLLPTLDQKTLSDFVVDLAEQIDITPQNPTVKVEDGKVIEFVAPRQGRALLQDETIELITKAIYGRASSQISVKEMSLPVVLKKPIGEGSAADLGIVELIGTATTPFTGSPRNRIHNIKNGVRFLSGVLVPPGEEFSTVGSLGSIDNTTGYLPELVIKGDETIPEYGGGLCQVSTTLFRTVMNAGLPITARRNHSYRVPYYERDGEGAFIGPGLDATIYSPNPDFKFVNNTETYILVQGFVEGDKVIFELYGTADGRTSTIDGPHTLETTPPGDPIYIETDTLPPGVTKKIDTAHPGGVAVATYTIKYSDGTEEEQEFKSYYRKWPEKYLIGAKEQEVTSKE